MKLFLLGATGRTGKKALAAALEKGWTVHALVRSPEKLVPHPRLKLFQGLPTEKNSLKATLSGCDAVLSVLNVSRTSDFPWAPLRTPPEMMSETMRALLPLMEKQQVSKLVVCSAWGVADSKPDIPIWFRWMIDHSRIGAAYADHERQEALIQASEMDWTLVRPVGLGPGKKAGPVRETFGMQPKPSLLISRTSLGAYLVETVSRADLARSVVVVSGA